jgi:mannose-6-phosphate isomerase-like protein (cupin superfamily)
MQIVKDSGQYVATRGGPNQFVEHLRSRSLSVGTYSIPAGGLDDQLPHREDEIYLVTAGSARLVTDTAEAVVTPGDLIYVPAGEGHRFTDISDDLALLVFFAPPYSGRG